jgi:hypothetical protein
MNIRSFILLLIAALALQNCKKEAEFFSTKEDLIPLCYSPDSLLCTAVKEVPGQGSVNWTANTFGGMYQGRLVLDFLTFQDIISYEQRERLSINIIGAKMGKFYLGNDYSLPFASYSRWLADGDVLNAVWDLDTEEDNWVEIVQMDTIAKTVTGKFDVHFKMTTQGSNGFVHSERINFSSGHFTTTY